MTLIPRRWFCLFGLLWPPNTPPKPDPIEPLEYVPPPDIEGVPCPDCGVRQVDGHCLACADGWVNA